jgi:toxin-antitoxin system PIN domain toxin
VILVDANLLVYACTSSLPQHEAARVWLDGRLVATPRVGLPWPSLLAFVRLTTNRRIFTKPLSLAVAWAQVEQGLDLPAVWIPTATEAHREVLAKLITDTGGRGSLATDAHLAALAIEHGLTLCSTDGDFSRFRGLRWENPLRT